MTSPRPSSIRVFLVDGRADGLRLVEKSNWTGLAMVRRPDYPRVRRREEWSRPGVYLPVGPSDGVSLRPRLISLPIPVPSRPPVSVKDGAPEPAPGKYAGLAGCLHLRVEGPMTRSSRVGSAPLPGQLVWQAFAQ
jgi:hypothetical protein